MFSQKFYVFLAVFSFSCIALIADGIKYEDKQLTITAKSTLHELYVDGVLRNLTYMYGSNWTAPDAVPLSPTNRLIGVVAVDLTTTCAGLLASVTSGYLVSDANWKCQIGAPPGWYSLGFDDSMWNNAHVIGNNNNVTSPEACTILTGIPSISPDSSWIWTPSIQNAPFYDQIIYCRAYLATCEQDSPCQNGGTCNRNNESICNCSPGYAGTYCELISQMSLAITAKTMLFELYVDGVPQSLLHGNNVSAADDILLPPYGRLIAATAIDTTFTCAGILASVTDDYFVTDASWKCHTDNSPQWYTLGFNDQNWTNAYVIGPNNNVTWPPECSILTEVSSISQNAYWIWTPTIVNTPYYDDIIYCRAYLPLCERNSPCKNGGTCNSNSVILCTCLHGYTGVFCENARNLSISAKSAVQELFVDGVQMNLTFGKNWTVADEIELSNVNRLISVYAVDLTSTCAGILASVTDDFMVTDAKWKCTTVAAPQWYSLGFDDTDWVKTYVIGPNGNVSWPEPCTVLKEIPAISQNASWIWTSTIPNAPYYDPVIYCRAYLPICERESPCQNGATCNENSVNLCVCAPGFTGIYCESVACEGDAPCQNGGTCNHEGDAFCQCPPALTGIFCEFIACEGDAPCQNGGTCIQESDAFCQCPPGFTGIFCEFTVCEGDAPCQNGGTCIQLSDAVCQCPPALTGIFCEFIACEGDAPCQNGGTCIQESDPFCQCPPTYNGTLCEFKVNRTLTLTAKSIVYELFIDGTKTDIIHATNWTIPDEVTLSPLSRLIGISAMDGTETCAGIIASVTGDYLVTDGINWRCGYIPDPHWFQLEWDDSVWDPAYIVGPNYNVTWPTPCQILTGSPSISPAANWIWTNTIPDTPYYHQTVYCRGYLPLCELESPCFNGGTCNKNNETLCSCLLGYIGEFCEIVDSKLLVVTAKEVLESLYIDGVQVNLRNGSDWVQTDSISIWSASRLIALVAHQLDSSCPGPGILASVTDSRGNYVLTDASWKCSPLAKNGWNELGYDDSTWQPAMLIQANNGSEVRKVEANSCQEFPIIPSISSYAFWIWTDSGEVDVYDVLVYCRGYLPICDAHPCKNGGTCNRNSNALCTCLSGFTGIYCENAILNHDAKELQRSVPDEILDDTEDGTKPT